MNTTIKLYTKYLSQHILLLLMCCLFGVHKANATHIYGADLFYEHVSGNTYDVTFVAYGDCGGSAFPNLATSSAQIALYNGSSFVTNHTLTLQNPTSGIEVTPVCPAQINNTKCSNGTLPGVKKFVYVKRITLSGTSTNWRFRFTGAMGGTTSAGRSNSITNIASSTSNLMNLEATLNNSIGNNNSAVYTTVPTPFFSINKPANYNHGTVDADGDSLSFSLVPGLTQTGTVTYLTGYSPTSPLAVATSTFSFNNQTGQLSFTPNLIQQSLVVAQVSEYRNGVLIGTSMREMTFVVLNNNNNPPVATIKNNNRGTILNNGTTIRACRSGGAITFTLNPSDQDNDSIDMVVAGLPTGATLTITNNGTKTPAAAFAWNTTGVAPGSYNFFVTFTDRGCPISSKQTVAYTIIVLPDPKVAITIDSLATCVKKAVITMTPSVAPGPWWLQVMQGSTTLHNFPAVANNQKDSLSPGTYTIRVKNADSCFFDTSIVIDPPPPIGIDLDITPLVCHDDSDAIVVVKASGGKAAFTYAKDAGAFGTVDTFKNLWAAQYTFKIKDENYCEKDTTITIDNPIPVDADVVISQPPCNYYNSGVIEITGKDGTSPYLYSFNGASFGTTNIFSGLYSGNYPVIVKDDNNCLLDTIVALPDSIRVSATAALTHILCNADSTGAITLNAYGATAPYRYQIVTGGGALTPINTFNNLKAQLYNFHIEDTNKCYLDTAITLTEPTPLVSNSSVTDVLCFGETTGAITINGNGGVSPYDYAYNTGAFSSTNVFSPLAAGTHTLRIRDDNGCIKDTTITITEPSKLEFDIITVTDAKCFGSSDGEVSIKSKGGVTPHEYAMGTGAFSSTSTFTGLPASTNTFYVRDDNNCTADTVITLSQPTKIIPSIALKQSTCTPLNNGGIFVGATGGTPGYRYARGLGGFSTNANIQPIIAGTYTVRIRDNNDCEVDTTVTVTDSLEIQLNITITDARCYDSSNGIISIIATNAVSPYTYALGTGSFGPTPAFGGLKNGTYTVRIKDDIGCRKDTTVKVNEPAQLRAFATHTEPSCYRYNDGTITVSATGGTPNYGYSVNGGSFVSSPNFSTLYAGNHIVRVKDANDCIAAVSEIMGQPSGMSFDSLLVTNLKCYNDKSGSVTIKGRGGSKPYTYTHNQEPYTNSNILTGINAGNNIIKIKDDMGCVIDSEVVFTEPAELLILNPLIVNPTCEGFADGSARVYGNGGVRPYTFAINDRAYTASTFFDNLKEGANIVKIKDAHGCEYDTTLQLVGHPHIIYENIDIDEVSCYGGTDGAITLNITGGKEPFTYQINRDATQANPFFENLNARQHLISVTDDFGCVKDSTILVPQPEKLELTTSSIPNDCEGIDNAGRIEVYATGGTGGYRYMWENDASENQYYLQGVENGMYQVVVTDGNNCVDSITGSIEYNNCCKIFIPNAFTPNNDGKNDKIRILVKGDFYLKTFAIFNRYGEMVYESSNIDEGWDGRYRSKIQDVGTFYYYVKGICGNASSEEVMYKGDITLIK